VHFKLENFQDCRQKYQLTTFKSIICVWSCRYLKANPFSSILNKISLIRLGTYSGSCLMSSLWEKLIALTEWELSWLRNELTLRDWFNQINLIKITNPSLCTISDHILRLWFSILYLKTWNWGCLWKPNVTYSIWAFIRIYLYFVKSNYLLTLH